MSVRAYRVIKKEVAEQATFNVWRDDKIIDFLSKKDMYNPENFSENGGSMGVGVDVLEEMLELENVKDLGLEDYHIEAIKADIAFAKKYKDDYVLYECY